MAKTMKVTFNLDPSGPLADGAAEEAIKDWLADSVQAVAAEGVQLLQAFPMNKSGRSDGGFKANLHMLMKGPDAVIPAPMIEGVTWGPWLEGTTKRNTSTRFKGYHLFRKTRLQLSKRAAGIAQEQLEKYLPQMGGKP